MRRLVLVLPIVVAVAAVVAIVPWLYRQPQNLDWVIGISALIMYPVVTLAMLLLYGVRARRSRGAPPVPLLKALWFVPMVAMLIAMSVALT